MLGWQEGLPQDGLAIVHFIIIYPNGFGQPRGDIGSATAHVFSRGLSPCRGPTKRMDC